jgi:DNA-binding response OmpR family regulator
MQGDPPIPGRKPSGARRIGPRALVIEDAADSRELYVRELESVGFTVFGADDGENGIQLVQRLQPALIILDLMLPGTSGFGVARWVRERSPRQDIAILAVSALTSETLRREALEAGCDSILSKPVEASVVVAEAVRILAEKVSLARRSV